MNKIVVSCLILNIIINIYSCEKLKVLELRIGKYQEERKKIDLTFQNPKISTSKKINILNDQKKSIRSWLIKHQNLPQDNEGMQFLKKISEETLPKEIRAFKEQLKKEQIDLFKIINLFSSSEEQLDFVNQIKNFILL